MSAVASAARQHPSRLSADELGEIWNILTLDERVEAFGILSPGETGDFFSTLPCASQAALLPKVALSERRLLMRALAPDDAADLIQSSSEEDRAGLLELLDDAMRKEVVALLAYAEDDAGGLMSPRFARVRPDMTVDEALSYLKRQARNQLETIYYSYVLDPDQSLRGVVSFRDLFKARGDKRVFEVMNAQVLSVPETMDQEEVARLMADRDLAAVPVVDNAGRMRGIVTVDDIVDVVQEEATEDIQKIGGSAALEAPYLQTGILEMVRKRGAWLGILFLGEMLTANAMARYQEQIVSLVALALFVPLIIASGGNSGSQASTLVIRAMALGELRLRDWWMVARRELVSGAALGALLGVIGVTRIVIGQALGEDLGATWLPLTIIISCSLIGVVTWGTVVGSMLPLLLRRLGFDPASASAPFVATLVDVVGLLLYFSIAEAVLGSGLV